MKNLIIYNEASARALSASQLLQAYNDNARRFRDLMKEGDEADNDHNFALFNKIEREAMTVEDNLIYLAREGAHRGIDVPAY